MVNHALVIPKNTKKKYKKILTTLAKGKRKGLTREEQRVLALWPENVTNKQLKRAVKRLRFQLGQSDKFIAGLLRSGQWKPHIYKTLKKMQLPRQLAALPHVESSFNSKAYSKVGAAGMWQFTRSTGRRFMRVDHVMDERLDPYLSTKAAAQLLKNNYSVTGTWPLALTAYNHGAAGMRRAAKKVGTKDIATIIKRYKSRSFGFASRNFYPSFLAAADIDSQPEKYFSDLKLKNPPNYEFVKLSYYYTVDTILTAFKIERREFLEANPALRPSVLSGNKYIPKDYRLRIHRSYISTTQTADLILASIDSSSRFKKQKPDRYHRVRRGQNLSVIAARYGVKVNDLVAVNNMRNRHRIRVGQVLILPQKKTGKGKTKQVIAKAPKPRPIKSEPIALPETGIYTVRRGDSIERIAKRYSLSLKQVLKLNKLSNKNKIFPGQKLVLLAQAEIEKPKDLQLAQLTQSDTTPTIPEAFEVEESSTEVIPEASAQQLVPLSEQTEAITVSMVETDLSELKSENLIEMTNANGNGNGNGEFLSLSTGITTRLTNEEVDLLADPSDYSVDEKNTIEIQAEETLGHYAEWLQIRASDLRRLNRMRYGKPVIVGKRLKLKFSKVTPKEFETQRLAYHKSMQEEFFEQNQIVSSEKYQMKIGQSLWNLANKKYRIPFWLLRQYNPDLDMNRITPKQIIIFPKIKQRILQS